MTAKKPVKAKKPGIKSMFISKGLLKAFNLHSESTKKTHDLLWNMAVLELGVESGEGWLINGTTGEVTKGESE